MGNVRLAYRSVFVILMVLIGILLTPVVQNGKLKHQGVASATNTVWHLWLARALGIRIIRHGETCDETALFVANHISWFDITALASQLPIRFLSKSEVRNWPLIGWLATKAGTLYIKRGGHGSKQAIIDMAETLRDAQHVGLFAEGTTTDGNIRRFHGRLIQSAIDAQSKVQPVAIYYPPEQLTDDARAHPDMLYIGDTSLAESMLWILRSRRITAELHFLETIDSEGRTRDEIATYCEQAIKDRLDARHQQTR